MLDNQTESDIIHQALEIFKDKIIIMIAHRLTTIKNADCISVINKGILVESGSHYELLKMKGSYYKLYQYQK